MESDIFKIPKEDALKTLRRDAKNEVANSAMSGHTVDEELIYKELVKSYETIDKKGVIWRILLSNLFLFWA